MEKLTSILVVANRSDTDRIVLEKAVLLARKNGARICLFSCDALLAKILQRAYSTEDAEKAWHISEEEHVAYLCALRLHARAPDVQISVATECVSPQHNGILRKIREIHPDLVIKSPSGEHPLRRFAFGDSDWQLIRACPATLMLAGATRWNSPPSFAALVNVSEEREDRLPENIVHTAEQLAVGLGSTVDVIYSEGSAENPERRDSAAAVRRLAAEYHIPGTRTHILNGDPDTRLPEFLDAHPFNALVLGAMTHRGAIGSCLSGLAGRLVDEMNCDFVLVKPAAARVPEIQVERRITTDAADTGRAPGGPAATHRSACDDGVLWNAMFGD